MTAISPLDRLLCALPALLHADRHGDGPEEGLPALTEVRESWTFLRARLGPDPALDALLLALREDPSDRDALGGVRVRLAQLLARRREVAGDLERLLPKKRQPLRVCTYNLHGVHDGEEGRYLRIARQLARLEPDLLLFQEVISGAGVQETSAQIARALETIGGDAWATRFAYCHLYYERFPEGVALCSRHPIEEAQAIDLTEGLPGGLRPLMERHAISARLDVNGRKVVAASVHLDHAAASEVRAAQAHRLVEELDRLYPGAEDVVVGGDFNDVEGSQALQLMSRAGFRDAFRCRDRGERSGLTFTAEEPAARIDFVLARGDLLTLEARAVLQSPELSDHFGVFAVLR